MARVNRIYKTVATDAKYAKKVRFVDIDPGFNGHRFCEPEASRDDQLNTDTDFPGVYLWNLNWPWQVNTNVKAPSPTVQAGNVSVEEAAQLLGDGGVTAWSTPTSGGGGNEPSNGWRLRPLHPRYTGYNAIIAQLVRDGLVKEEGTSGTTPNCSHVGDGYKCTDGSTPEPDEDNRCCLYNQPNNNDQCFP